MKKLFLIFLILCSFSLIFTQQYVSVDIYNDIYNILDNAQLRGLCDFLPGAKPYSQKKIITAVNQILEHSDKLTQTEIHILSDFLKSKEELPSNKFTKGNYYIKNNQVNFPLNFNFFVSLESFASGSIYNTSDYSNFGFDFMPIFGFLGDVGNNFSYMITGLVDVSKMPLYLKGNDYDIGTNWFNGSSGDARTKVRKIKTYDNSSNLPYTYRKRWGGQFYYLSNMSSDGLEGWAQELGVSGNIFAELNMSFLQDKINIGIGRVYREWAAMDKRSSLVLNGSAMPFFGINMTFEILPSIKYSSLTGTLEYPNQDYILSESLPGKNTDDAYYWQNAFSISMIEFDTKHLHLDFGSSVVFPKRFELGYLFPLTNYVEYQNHIGDYDNLALFGDIKLRKANFGELWASLYLDELNGLRNNPITSSRAMFAGQIGAKSVFPWLSFGSVALRYTKVEPFCYTHHSINYVPYYSDYVCENYSNNGYNIGSYLPPNSDEILLRFDATPHKNIDTSFQYQMIRHGADYGSQQVRGSSIYSELDNQLRSGMKKYFLHDGAYEWTHILSCSANIFSRSAKLPFKVTCTAGLVISYYTMIDQNIYNTKDEYNNTAADFKTNYSKVNTTEYPFRVGPVFSVGLKLYNF